MSTKANEQVSPTLLPEQIQQALVAFPKIVISLFGKQIIQATYGFGCHLHPGLCYVPLEVGTSWLERFIDDSIRQQIVVPGESEFIFTLQEDELEVVFCHEGDIHISGTNLKLITELLADPAFSELMKFDKSIKNTN